MEKTAMKSRKRKSWKEKGEGQYKLTKRTKESQLVTATRAERKAIASTSGSEVGQGEPQAFFHLCDLLRDRLHCPLGFYEAIA